MAALVLTTGSAAWAGKNRRPRSSGGSTTGGTGNSQFGWVIPITFSFAPSGARVLWLSSCPSSARVGSPSQVSFKTTDQGSGVMGQHILLSVSGPATYWGSPKAISNTSGIGAITVVPYGPGVVTVQAKWDLDGNGAWNPSFEPAAAPACVLRAA